MASVNPRALRLAERIQVIVAQFLESRVKDPRIGFLTITDVKVTGDLQSADIFYTVFGDEKSRQDTAAALKSAKGLIRSELGKQLGLRLTPAIEFHLDSLPESAANLNEALAQAHLKDQELRRLRETASYAGEADPYRRDDQEEKEDFES